VLLDRFLKYWDGKKGREKGSGERPLYHFCSRDPQFLRVVDCNKELNIASENDIHKVEATSLYHLSMCHCMKTSFSGVMEVDKAIEEVSKDIRIQSTS